MLFVTCPKDNIEERTYAIRIMFEDLLGLSSNCYSLQFEDNAVSYIITLPDGKRITVEDHFFGKHKEPLSYINEKNLPVELNYFHAMGMEIPIIYGVDKYIEEEGNVILGVDIFASLFFMLTRWEESLLGREENGDCDENQLFAVKFGFEKRPVVNEYETILRKILLQNDVQVSERKFEMVLTHDVDGIITPSYSDIAKHFVKQVLGRMRVNNLTVLSWRQELKYKKAFPNIDSQFKIYSNLCKQYGIQEWFYFKVCAKGETEATYFYDDKRTIEIIKKLRNDKDLNSRIGFHPSQTTFNNEEQWNVEKNRIYTLLGQTPLMGRNHHLLYNSSMLHWWEKMCEGDSNATVNISNCVFHKRLGFRSGVVIPYFLFDVYQRRQLNVKEYPCQIMDTAIRRHNYLEDEWKNDAIDIVNQTKVQGGKLILTWHIYKRNTSLISDYIEKCWFLINYACSHIVVNRCHFH